MNTDPTNTDATNASGPQTDWVGLGLAQAVTEVRIGPVPVGAALAGGRRLRRRRRALVGALALSSAVVLAGGAVAGLHQVSDRGAAAAVIAPAAAGPTATAAVRDPLTPVRTVLAQGSTADGKQWKAWAALWPKADRERSMQQAQLVWQERHAADPELAAPTAEFVQQYWQPDEDVVNLYFTLDGVRLANDSTGSTPAPSSPHAGTAGSPAGVLLGHLGKGDTVAPVDLAVLQVGSEVGRIVVTWQDGSNYEPPLTALADSPAHWVAVPRPPGRTAKQWQFYDRNGTLLSTDPAGLLH
ncbi:hypothetical protein AB0K43_01735 [Kitasatospora sp. NPDC049258]|uniref:hypothetical protein n=1 Tax=Kitasatospora sp. NPDC049258 TaxID=3155394 RepID=UPI0034190D27